MHSTLRVVSGAGLLIACTLALGAQTPVAPAASISIDTLMATPFPTDLVAAPTAGRIAWVSSNSGVHNVLVADPAPGTAATGGLPDHK